MLGSACSHSGPLAVNDPCVRAYWAALTPSAVLLVILALHSPIRHTKLFKAISNILTDFLSLEEAVAIENNLQVAELVLPPVPLWRTLSLAIPALLETVAWLALSSYRLVMFDFNKSQAAYNLWAPLLVAISWFYASLKPVMRHSPTPPYDLFILYLVHVFTALLSVGSAIYGHYVYGETVSNAYVLATTIHFTILGGLLAIVFSMPLGVPTARVDKEEIGRTISPEDYTTLFKWITFLWVYPLIKKGTTTPLNEKDVWVLSPSLSSRPLFTKFSAFAERVRPLHSKQPLAWILLKANSLDLILDSSLTILAIFFNYASPFFLKRILDAVSIPAAEHKSEGLFFQVLIYTRITDATAPDPTRPLTQRELRAQALVYAILALVCTCLKAQADLQHLWYGRRAATRARSELMAAIYDKALKRRDASGLAMKNKEPEGDEEKAETKSADTGKIVNLMSGDANRVAMMASAAYMIYGAPFEVVIGAVFLYQLMGMPAFAGFLVLVAATPLNSILTKRGISISHGTLRARDARMAVLNELISEVKFIKFFAWEDRWIARALKARAKELDWLIKERFNSILFWLLWTLSPVCVSIVSFTVFVTSGGKLTVSVAFTAIQLFNMIKLPLNVIPAFIVQLLQTGVAIDRINAFLAEEEVPDFVSCLKGDQAPPPDNEESYRLGVRDGWFRWNEAPQEGRTKKEDKKVPYWKVWKHLGSPRHRPQPTNDETGSTVTIVSESSEPGRRFELRDVNIDFPVGELTVITGPTASGKTALLMALMGELTAVSDGQPIVANSSGADGPKIFLPKHPSQYDVTTGLKNCISYAAQAPWLEHLTIKGNILFGSPYEEERYNEVIRCCALQPDLDVLEDGDQTEIGARGVSLSGGQKARVALARAVYARTKHVLLDDPLSAVDSHTAKFLFEQLFQGPLMKDRTVLLVTHHVELVLPGTYYLVRMLDGRIDTHGTVKALKSQGLLEEIAHDEQAQAADEPKVILAEDLAGAAEEPNGKDRGAAAAGQEEDKSPAKTPKKLVDEEARATGSVKWPIYNVYLKASSYTAWVAVALITLLQQIAGIGEKIWIQLWGEAGQAEPSSALSLHPSYLYTSSGSEYNIHFGSHFIHPSNWTIPGSNLGSIHTSAMSPIHDLPSADDHPLFYVSVYAALGIGICVIGILGVIAQMIGSYRASKLLFSQLLNTVVRATMRWHDTTPTGRIMNRFAKDFEVLDSSLSSSIRQVGVQAVVFVAAVFTVAAAWPGFFVLGPVIGYLYVRLSIGYLRTGRDLRRMESTTRSPIFASFGETLEGIVTVRAFSAERRFLDTLHAKIDETTSMWYNFWMLNRWLLLNFDIIGGLSVFLVTLLVLGGWISDWLAGLTITSAMTFTTSVYWTCRMVTQLELDLNSIERVVEYLELPQEPPSVVESNRPPAYWPSMSSNSDSLIRVEDLVIKYAPSSPSVLHGVSFAIKPREKVGLLGRTGSGKSTLAMALLRFVDPVEGKIVIDGIDIRTIGLQDLRSRITIIPQDSVLFSGTIRENLDPFEEHSDSACLDALYRVQLVSQSEYQSRRGSRAPSPSGAASEDTAHTHQEEISASIGLETEVSAGGSNFSSGQRQLISMARALLRQSSIVIFDEATSSIDFKTDSKIQATVRAEFANSCLLTIAHRIRTVIDYDRLIILDKGVIAEFDTPLSLIRKEGGIFRGMCLKSGQFKELEEVAQAKAVS